MAPRLPMHPFSPETVRRAQAGDAAARDALLTACQPLMRSFFISRIGRVPEVDDLTQNALLRVHRGLDVLQDPDRVKAMAMKAALFELHDHYRGRYSTRETLYDPDLPAPGSVEPDDVALQMDLRAALAGLSDHARRILELRELGYPYLDIAETLGTSEAAVKMQVKRAFEKLRTSLAGAAVLLLFALPIR
ncbi:MAG TPA: sigma-70 family RNA polymerase sigma factor [Rubricoccaceae bacterium]